MVVYMGADKHENEELLKYGLSEDIWFHVDKLSSAHVYLRPPRDMAVEDIPEAAITDCVQLVKANSIQGNKLNGIDVVYTPYPNLKKTGDMVVGQVGFHSDKAVKKVRVEKRVNEIVNRLNKTKVEKHPDLREERDEREQEDARDRRRAAKKREEEEKVLEKERKEQAALRSYDTLMDSSKMEMNDYGSDPVDARAVEDDFM